MQVAGKAYALPNGRMREKLYGMVGLITANQFWFCWSLSDKELQDYYQTNKNVSDVLTALGFDVPALTVGAVATGAYAMFKDGVKKPLQGAVSDIAKSNKIVETAKRMGIKDKLKGTGGKMLGAFVILIIGFNAMAQKSSSDAKKELILRGLIDPSEL